MQSGLKFCVPLVTLISGAAKVQSIGGAILASTSDDAFRSQPQHLHGRGSLFAHKVSQPVQSSCRGAVRHASTSWHNFLRAEKAAIMKEIADKDLDTTFTSLASARWKTLSPDEKAAYQTKKEVHATPATERSRDSGSEPATDAELAGYLWYAKEVFPALKKRHPDMSTSNMVLMAADLWNRFKDKQRQVFITKAKQQ